MRVDLTEKPFYQTTFLVFMEKGISYTGRFSDSALCVSVSCMVAIKVLAQ
jgi:hypothetical protein